MKHLFSKAKAFLNTIWYIVKSLFARLIPLWKAIKAVAMPVGVLFLRLLLPIAKAWNYASPKIGRLISNWRGAIALLIAAGLFILSPGILRLFDPTSGVFDVGYLQRPLVAAAYFFFATFCVWTTLQIDWPTADQWIDRGGFRRDWETLLPRHRVVLMIAVLFGLLAVFLASMALVPV